MYRLLGACTLAFTFSAAAQSAGGAAAAGGTSGGNASAGTAAGSARVAAPSSGPRSATSAAGAPGQSVSGRAGQNVTATPGQNVSATPGQSVTATPGQSVTTTPGQNPNAAAQGQPNTTANGGVLPGQNPAGATLGASTTATASGNPSTPIAFTTLPANLQAQIANQIPPGAQLSQVVQETTPQGNTVYRAQIIQNGAMREIALNAAGTAPQNFTTSGNLQTAAQQSAGTTAGGFLATTPVAIGTLPTPVQGALSTAANGTPLSNLTFTPGVNGAGVYRGVANGRPVEVRVGPNGQILPAVSNTTVAATASSATSTNDLKIDDLPQAARDAIQNSVPYAEVTRIRRVDSASGDLYDVTLRGEGKESRMRVSESGTVVEENVDLPVSIAAPAPIVTNESPKLVFNTLPNTVRDAIGIRTDQRAIRTLTLTNYNGKTAYMVDYLDKNALRQRLFIGKDGLVVNTVTNVMKIRPAGGDMVVVADLPASARHAIQQQAGDHVQRVDKTVLNDQDVYVVTYTRDGELQQMILSQNGQRLNAVGAPAAAETGSQNK